MVREALVIERTGWTFAAYDAAPSERVDRLIRCWNAQAQAQAEAHEP
jgi:hypothetical protein